MCVCSAAGWKCGTDRAAIKTWHTWEFQELKSNNTIHDDYLWTLLPSIYICTALSHQWALKFQGDPLEWVFHNIPCSCSPLSCSLFVLIDFSHFYLLETSWNTCKLAIIYYKYAFIFGIETSERTVIPLFLENLGNHNTMLELNEIKIERHFSTHVHFYIMYLESLVPVFYLNCANN